MDRNIWAGVGVGLAVGLGIGYFIGRGHGSDAVNNLPLPVATQPAAVSPELALQRRIFDAQQATQREPNNVQAWISLGNDYYDSHQPQKSIEAYDKALALDPRNPNVLTDQGIMYRELKAFDKALANFQKANAIDPKHLQSLFNQGIVYAQDLKDKPKAIKVWKRVIELDPASLQAQNSQKAIEELNASPALR
ncbi:MAG: tetratricopeptide repeat protein [Holophaga sp.]|nr:tetratricopeptide repeat protein [Holophaga sp.]